MDSVKKVGLQPRNGFDDSLMAKRLITTIQMIPWDAAT